MILEIRMQATRRNQPEEHIEITNFEKFSCWVSALAKSISGRAAHSP